MEEVLRPTPVPGEDTGCGRCGLDLAPRTPAWSHTVLDDDGVDHQWLCLRCARPLVRPEGRGRVPQPQLAPATSTIGAEVRRQLAGAATFLLALSGVLLFTSLLWEGLQAVALLAVAGALCCLIGAGASYVEERDVRREVATYDRLDALVRGRLYGPDAVTQLLERFGFTALHQRRDPTSGIVVQRVAMGRGGVYVLFTDPDLRGKVVTHPRLLQVGGQDATDLVDLVTEQTQTVARVLAMTGLSHVPVTGVVCLLVADTTEVTGTVADITVTGPGELAQLLRVVGARDRGTDPERVADLLTWHLPAA